MAQASDNTVDNGTGAAVRSDINARLAALFSNHSGATDTAMVTKYAYQTWADTTASQLKLRNSGNTAWIPLRGLNGSVVLPDGANTTPSITFDSDGTDQGFYRVEGQISGSVGVAYTTQFGGSNYTLFTVGKNEGGVASDGPSLYWNYQGNPTATSNTTNEGLIIQQRGRIRIAMKNADCMRLNRVGSGNRSDGTAEEIGTLMQFLSNGTLVGRIGMTDSDNNNVADGVELVDESDRRLKDNITDMPEAKSRINQIQMRRFRLIASNSYKEGFIAQELKDICPNAVVGSENDVDENGDPVYMGVAKATLVPLLMKGLQEAYAEIAALTARIDALEAA